MRKSALLKLLALTFVVTSVVGVFSACGTVSGNQSHVHEFEYTTTANATCKNAGSMFGVCKCGETTTITIPQKEHNFVNGICSECGSKNSQEHQHSYQQKVTNPTCESAGVVFYECECGDSYSEQIPALGHNYVNYVCNVCGHALEVTPNEYFYFTLLSDDTYEISAKDVENMPENLVLPYEYNGKPVTSIGWSAFSGVGAFRGCSSLTSIEIPDSVTSIGYGAFCECNSLTSVVIGDSVTSIGSSAFERCSLLTSIEIPDSVTSIGQNAFDGCYRLVEVINKSTHITVTKSSDSNGYVGYYALSVSNCDSSYVSKLSNDNGFIVYTEGEQKILVGYNGEQTDLVIPAYITKINDYAFYKCSSLTSIEIGGSVTSIDQNAFEQCSSLTSIEIPDSVISIGNYAFYGCSSLTSIEIPNSVTSIGHAAFSDCTSLTSISIPDSVTSIGAGAFMWCYSLTSIVIGDSVTEIGEWAFVYCSSLTSIMVSENNANYCSLNGNLYSKDKTTLIQYAVGKKAQTFIIPDSVTFIGDVAFLGCASLTSIAIPDGVTSIGDYAFDECYRLVEVINKSSHITVTKGSDSNGYVGYHALSVSNCDSSYVSKLSNDNGFIVYTEGEQKILVGYNGEQTDLVVPSYITKINNYAFEDCSLLTSIVIPDGVTSIGGMAFYKCSSLNYNIEDNLKYLGNKNNPYLYLAGVETTEITTAKINKNCKFIGDCAFYGCSSLISIEIPDSVTSIGGRTFDMCSSLISIVIPDGVTSIGGMAFFACHSLTSVVIPDSVTSIGNYAFDWCDSLTIYCEAQSKPSGWSSIWNFSNRPVVWGYKEG